MHCKTFPALAVLVAATLAVPALADDLPTRKSGLWEINVQRSGGAGKDGKSSPASTMTQCVDQAMDQSFHQMGQQMGQEMKCTVVSRKRTPAGFASESTCDLGTTKISSKTLLTGDFDRAYRVDIQTRYDPPFMGRAESSTLMEAKWTGACKPGQRPGER